MPIYYRRFLPPKFCLSKCVLFFVFFFLFEHHDFKQYRQALFDLLVPSDVVQKTLDLFAIYGQSIAIKDVWAFTRCSSHGFFPRSYWMVLTLSSSLSSPFIQKCLLCFIVTFFALNGCFIVLFFWTQEEMCHPSHETAFASY